jgi:hypothetical protein
MKRSYIRPPVHFVTQEKNQALKARATIMAVISNPIKVKPALLNASIYGTYNCETIYAQYEAGGIEAKK